MIAHGDSLGRTRIKFCGLTRIEDINSAVAAGADALGFVLWGGSKRHITLHQLEQLSAAVPAFVTRVGLFVDAAPECVEAASEYLDLLQFHGNETPAMCQQFSRPWIKALRMRDGLDLEAAAQQYAQAQGLLLDAYRPGIPGGTGEIFDWSRIPARLEKPVILAGGLTPRNVADAIKAVGPLAVDVSGGIEVLPGIKDARAMAAFVKEARRVNG
ncbi:phosphoribosylanthranilate isomerase [Halomonas halocynthiae]|uniref:phosphoribosylanthranilate isomerase n=1 Tax=Halomonas halocynthiae TaxID=176290 RepID=UPI00041676A3|nr:phosphoribosylanthranilate isomerase [Halomonas halocynthiae]